MKTTTTEGCPACGRPREPGPLCSGCLQRLPATARRALVRGARRAWQDPAGRGAADYELLVAIAAAALREGRGEGVDATDTPRTEANAMMKCDARERLFNLTQGFLAVENAGARGQDVITEQDLADELDVLAEWYAGTPAVTAAEPARCAS